jgi:hypothetical protein
MYDAFGDETRSAHHRQVATRERSAARREHLAAASSRSRPPSQPPNTE